nr:ASCH domain-containing protein [Cohnella mopanensis]
MIIKPKWADLIHSGEKTWEIRGKWAEARGTIFIIKSGSV